MATAKDERSGRQWVKVQLRNDELAVYVVQIVGYWKSLKTATHNVTRAIYIYYQLTQGNTEPLLEDFPMLRAMFKTNGEQPSAAPPAAPAGKLKKRHVEKTHEEDVDDFLSSMGL